MTSSAGRRETPIGGDVGDRQWNQRLVGYSLRKAIIGSLGPQFAGNVDWGAERETSAELARRSERQPAGFLVPRAAFSVRVADASPDLLRMAGIERRVVSVTLPATGPGSNIIAENLMADQFIDALRAQVAVKQMGARIIGNLVGNIHLPRLKDTVVTGWFADNTNLPTTDESFDQVSFTPKHCGAIAEYSRNVLLQSSPDIESVLRMDFAKVLAQAVDRAAISGTGNLDPMGIVSDPATPNTGAAAGSQLRSVDRYHAPSRRE
jgi:HK97 family phage major capsid protein